MTVRDRLLRVAAVQALVVPPAVAAFVVLIGLTEPGYDPTRATVSRLAAVSSVGIFVKVAIAGLGLSLALFAAVLARCLGGRPWPGALALGLGGLGIVGGTVIGLDANRLWFVAIHRLLSTAALVCLAAAPILIAAGLRRDENWPTTARIGVGASATTFGLLLLALVLFLGHQPLGGLERLIVTVPLVWMCLVAVEVMSASGRPAAREPAVDIGPARRKS
jgi:hypothetical membrane protein